MLTHRPGPFLARHWPCAVALGVLAVAVAVLLSGLLGRCAGHLVYPLDDTYIHMAVARNLALHGVWGVSRDGFSSPCSSLLWPLLLAAGYLAVGVRDGLPLLLGALCAAGLLVWLWRQHLRLGHPRWYGFISLLLIGFLTPLPSMVVLGMEHLLHALVTLAFAGAAAWLLAAERPTPRQGRLLCLLAALLTMARYEGLFLLGAVCLLLLCRRRWRLALVVGLCGAAPLLVFGGVALAHGFSFLPNSVMLKAGLAGTAVNFQPLSSHLMLGRMIDNRHLLVPFVATLVPLMVRLQGRRDPWESGLLFGALYILAFIPQYLTVQASLFSRYDAYLCAFGLEAFLLNLPAAVAALRWPAPRPARHPGWLLLVLLPLLPWLASMARTFVNRAQASTGLVAPGAGNIYEQQYQMGRFLRAHYPGAAVAANDIGAICYLADIDCLDLFGLASAEVLQARRRGQFDARTLERLAARQKVRIALFYEQWLGGNIPEGWKKAGDWIIPDRCVCGSETVSFYAVDPAEFGPLRANLRTFVPSLPRSVRQVVADGK